MREQAEEKDDMLKALRHDGLLKTEYRPDTSAEPTAANLWKEMLRFKECISQFGKMPSSASIFLRNNRGVSPDGMVRTGTERGCPAGHPSDNH